MTSEHAHARRKALLAATVAVSGDQKQTEVGMPMRFMSTYRHILIHAQKVEHKDTHARWKFPAKIRPAPSLRVTNLMNPQVRHK